MNQTKRVLRRLRTGPLTQVQALNSLGVGRLGARVLELREAGHSISTETITVKNRFGEKCRVGRYRLVSERT